MWDLAMAIKQIQKKEGKLPPAGDVYPIHFPDFSKVTVNVKETTLAKDVFVRLLEHVGVSKGLQFFALVENREGQSSDVSHNRVLSENEPLLKSLKKASTKLVFKKVVFLDRNSEDTIDCDNPTVLNFQYCQAVQDAIGFYHLPENTTMKMAGLQMRISGAEASTIEENLHEYLPYYMMSTIKAAEEKGNWAQEVIKQANDAANIDKEECKIQYIRLAQTSPIYGSSFYPVSVTGEDEKPVNYVLGVNRSGVHLLEEVGCALKASFPYGRIVKWGRSPHSFNVIHGESE